MGQDAEPDLAAAAMAGSELAREVLGDASVDHITNSRLWEWREFGRAVTS